MADATTGKKRKANPAYGERKKRQKERVFTAIKTGVQKLCRDNGMYMLLQKCVWKASLIACESSMLASLHVLRLLENGQPLPVMDHTFFNQCVSSIANLSSGRTCERRNPALVQSLAEYRELHPEGYEPVERLPCMTQMLVMVAQQAQENFAVSTDMTLISRLARWFRLRIKQHSAATGTTYFTDNESHIIKSVVSVLTRASTQEPYSVAGLVARYTRFQQGQYPIPEAELVWMQTLCDDVRARIGPLPLRAKKNPQDYLPFLHFILRDLETYNDEQIATHVSTSEKENPHTFRLFSLLPQKKVRPINIKINNTVLADMHKYLQTGVHLEGRDLWEYYFNTKLVSRSERKDFEEFMVTDGLSASLIVSRPKRANEEASPQSDQLKAQQLLESATRVVAVDPGRNPVFTAVVHNQAALDTLQSESPDNVKHKVIKWTKRRFYQEAGYTHRNKVTKLWTGKAPLITTFNEAVLTAKTSSLERYKAHARHVLANLETLMSFYNAQRFKRLRWKTYISRQKAYEKLVSELTAGDPNTLIVWGDARFAAAGRGSPAVPTSAMRKKVGSRARTLDHDEFRTSKLSACCHTPLQSLLDPQTGERSWELRICQNNACPRRIWERNVSAAINILYLFLEYVRARPRPQAFRRSNVVDEADVVEVVVDIS